MNPKAIFLIVTLDRCNIIDYFYVIKSLPVIQTGYDAKVAQLVERDLAKVEVAGSNPVFRSTRKHLSTVLFL